MLVHEFLFKKRFRYPSSHLKMTRGAVKERRKETMTHLRPVPQLIDIFLDRFFSGQNFNVTNS